MHPRSSVTLRRHLNLSTKYNRTDCICRRYSTSNDQVKWKSLFSDYGKRNNFKENDWYELSPENLDEKTQQIVNDRFQGSMLKVLSTLFPETEWHAWKFKHQNVPHRYWKDINNQRKFFDQLGRDIGIQSLDDWYTKLSSKLMKTHGASTLLAQHNGSAIKALKACYPERAWLPWKFHCAPKFWKSVDNQREYFQWLGKELGVEHLDDWYKVLNQKVIGNNYAGTLLKLYNYSPSKALMACYPDHEWKPWKFQMTTQNYFNAHDHVSKYLSELAEKFSIQTLDDWYRVDRVQLHQQGAGRLLAKFGGLHGILKQQYPDYPWDRRKFMKGRKAQRWLVVTLKKMFPKEGMLSNVNLLTYRNLGGLYSCKSYFTVNKPTLAAGCVYSITVTGV